MKKIKIALILLFFLFVIIGIVMQVKAEKYLSMTKSEYGVFLNKKRLRHTPYIFFYIDYKLNRDSYDCYIKNTRLPYLEKGLLEKYWFDPNYATYFMFCYYPEQSNK